MGETQLDIETFLKADEMMRVFRTAVRKAREEHRRLGVANVYSINGQIYYELPNGEITRTPPEGFAQFDSA
jgi:hypothetical protein